MNSEVVGDSESNSSDQGDDKTFINKLLVEMKSQFNRTESKKQASVAENSYGNEASNDLPTEDSVVINYPTNNIEEENDAVIVASDNNVDLMNEENTTSSLQEIEGKVKDDVENVQDVDETLDEEFEHEKPRIVLTFRKPNKPNDDTNLGRRSLRHKINTEENPDEKVLKRSARRRSKDCSESVLQSAIARKEKSYNESNKPQRLTRQLKPTQKILENIASAALKLEKNKSDIKSRVSEKQKLADMDSSDIYSNTDDNESEEMKDIDNVEKKHKHKHHSNKHSKHNAKKPKVSERLDSDSDQSGKSIRKSDSSSSLSDNSKASSKKVQTVDEQPHRRSQRISSSRFKEELDMTELMQEASTGEHQSLFPADPECSSVGAQLIASRLCLCTQKTQIFVTASENDTVYCTAVDNINGKLVGCNNVADTEETSLLRPSSRVPYIILCKVHYNRMLRHNCCPTCGVFCTQGKFTECEAKHHYHRECQISVGDVQCCPHCGISTPDDNVYITMHSTKKPILLPVQKFLNPSAKMSFPSATDASENYDDNKRSISPPIVPPDAVNIRINLMDSVSIKYDSYDVLHALKTENLVKLAEMLSTEISMLNAPLKEYEGGNVLHYAAQNGLLAAVHMLNVAGVELDMQDNEQNSPLLLAILAHKNHVVGYLVKVGANIALKGTDGMTALHLAAKCGNLEACEVLLKASLGIKIKDYINMGDDGGWTPLVWACEHGHTDVAIYLIKNGADPNLRDVEQNIALHWAAFSDSARITEWLLNNGSDVNAVNAHGESPLHIGARQDNYNCVLILLARGANVNLVNKLGETPLECVPQMDDCYNAIALNVHLLAGIKKPQKILFGNDISNGRETNPIQCMNRIDVEPEPTDYVYVTKNCVTADINIDKKITSLQCCSCEDRCNTNCCLCGSTSLKCWYDDEGKLVSDFNYLDPPMIFECNEKCKCNAITCVNRVMQRGLTQRFQLFRTEKKGWGICTLRAIPKGAYVCEYIGEIISDSEAEQREDDSYLFDLDIRENDGESFCMDAKHYGNLARFINHSCEPNLLPVKVFIDHHDLRFPRIGLFASRDIMANEELSFDYGEKFWIIKYKSFTCECGSATCKYSVETIINTLENHTRIMQEEDD